MKVILATLPTDIPPREADFLRAQVQGLATQVRLEGIPPHSYEAFFYQILTGMGPEWTGVYDNVKVIDYHVMRATITREVEGKLIWDIVQGMGKITDRTGRILPESLPEFVYLDAQTPNDLESLYELAGEQIIKVVILPDFVLQSSREVNVNNLLENKGLLERAVDGSIQWEETLAYHVGHGQVWINLMGREVRGVVTPGQEYDQVRNALAKILKEQLVDSETGASVVESVWKKEDLYSNKGDHFVHGPDLVLTFRPGYVPSFKSVQLDFNNKEISNSDKANITIDSFLMLIWGNGIKRGYSGTGHTLDVVPTVLYLLDLPLPRMLRGRVIRDIFTPEFWDNHPMCYQTESGITPTEEALLMDRLEALGYID